MTRPSSGPFKALLATEIAVAPAPVGFTWRRTRVTGGLYKRFFNAPVRPTYNGQVREMLHRAGFDAVYHRPIPRHLPRQHHWIAVQSG